MNIQHSKRIVGLIREYELTKEANTLIAISIAYALPTPTKPDDNVFSFWANHALKINTIIDTIAQQQVINQVLILDTCKEVWLHRVKAYWEPIAVCPECFAEVSDAGRLAYKEIVRILRLTYPTVTN